MALVNSALTLDFAQRIAERTELFQGRGWVFNAVERWLAEPDKEDGQVFLLTGEPGSGKSAIAGRLVQFSQGSHTPPEGSSRLKQGFLSAIHFCSARDSSWIDPHNFTRSIAHQLASRYEVYARALPNVGDKTVNIGSSEINIGQVKESATVNATGINVNINLGGLSALDAFNRAVLDPLRSIYNNGFDEPITILVDALDESLSYEGGTTILNLISRLDSLPRQVRFIFTSRNDDRVTNEFLEANLLYLSAKENDELNRQDIADYVLWRLNNDEHLATATASLSAARLSEVAAQLKERASGNFLYVAFVLNAVARGQRSIEELDELPDGLDKLYYDSLNRVVKLGRNDWSKDYAPLMGTLSVAREPMSRTQLQSFLNIGSESALEGLLRDLRQFTESVHQRGEGDEGEGDGENYRLYHQSVVDFLHRPLLADKKKQLKNSYYLPPVEWNRRIVDSYLKDEPIDWGVFDDYGLRHIATHLAEVAQANCGPQQKAERHRQTERLSRVVRDKDFQEAHSKRIKDLVALQRDIEQALKCVSVDDHKDALFLAVETAIALVAFRRERLRPEQMFELAKRGEAEAAERQLELYTAEPEWREAARLIIAWLASHKNPAGARKLFFEATQNAPSDPNLEMLRERLAALLDGNPAPPYYLPPVPPAEVVAEMVKRFGGLDANVEMLEGFRGTGMGDPLFYQVGGGSEQIGYIAERDGPFLISFAVAEPTAGAGFLNDYLSVHTNYNYAQYRNRSLWALLNSILRHPQQNWVEALLPVMASTALSGSVLEFQEALPLTTLGLQAQAGDSQSLRELEESRDEAVREAQSLLHGRGQGDTWGRYKRRLAALAEAFSVLFDNRVEALNLLGLASSLPYGFAGFQSPACLSLAESIRICSPGNTHDIQTVLDASRRAAHNIQDATFCARLTARYNAMAGRWWQQSGSMPDLEQIIERLHQNPSDPEFSARHIVGEPYQYRSPGAERLPLPVWAREADTLAALAQLYQRPLSEFQRLNSERGWQADEHLPPGTEINVPDAGFATHLAVRFAAEVLADDSLSTGDRVSLLQSLVPLAAPNSTALDGMLSRLFLAARPMDSALLENIGEAARGIQANAATTVLQVNNEMLMS
jgi:hypothetical protein